MQKTILSARAVSNNGQTFMSAVRKDFQKNKMKYLMILPVVLFFLIFSYKPMYGAIIAFKNYSPHLGFNNSPWVGFNHFIEFFNSFYFIRVLRNTLVISIYDIVFGFPAPIILAILLNEIRSNAFKRTVQTISYMPYFVSMVIICGLIRDFSASNGVINQALQIFGAEKTSLLQRSELFSTIYVGSNLWQQIGWNSIIYLSALTGIDAALYEAAMMDGAGRLKRIFHITIPGIMPTIAVLFILRMGNILNVGFEKILLLYNPVTYDTADVISTYVYRKGLLEFNWSMSAAVGLFNSVINFGFLVFTNWMSKKVNGSSLW